MTDLLQLASELTQRHIACALCTVIRTSGSVPRHPGSKMLVSVDGAVLGGTVGGGAMESRVCDEARQALSHGRPILARYQLADPDSGDPGVCGGEVEVFIEPLLNAPTMLIIGAGHVGRSLTHLAKWSGFRVLLADDRSDYCNAETCPGADEYLVGPSKETLAKVSLIHKPYIALVTRSYPIDVEVLPSLLRMQTAYIGVIGSQRRWLMAAKALREQGVTDAELARIHAPIGVDIGAETPEEIAVSIMAEIIHVQRG